MPLSPPSISPQREAEVAIRMTLREEGTHEEVDPKEEERVFRKAFLDMTEMVRVLYQERNERIEGEVSKLHKEGQGSSRGHNDEDKSKKGNGGNGGSGKSPSSPSSSSSSTSSSVHQSHKSKNTGKSPFLKLDVKFELLMFNGEFNAENLDNWIRQLEVYLRIQNHDDDTKIQLASLRMEGATLVWWEAKTKEEIKKHGKIILSWTDFITTIKQLFYRLAHM